MAYPLVPGRRMAWDVDGTVALSVVASLNGAAVPAQADGVAIPTPYADLGPTDKGILNSEDVSTFLNTTGSTSNNAWIVIVLIFPELREIDGVFRNGSVTVNTQQWLYSSPDTTNGIDGTWSAVGSQVLDANTTLDRYRTDIQSAALTNRRAIASLQKATGTGSNSHLRRLHVYGEISPGETPDRLLWVDDLTGTEFGLPIDYGDIPRGSAEDRVLILRNNSSTMTASGVQITAEGLYGDFEADFTFQEAGGGSFQATLPITGSISPTSDSVDITLRRITPDDAVVGPQVARALAAVGSWT